MANDQPVITWTIQSLIRRESGARRSKPASGPFVDPLAEGAAPIIHPATPPKPWPSAAHGIVVMPFSLPMVPRSCLITLTSSLVVIALTGVAQLWIRTAEHRLHWSCLLYASGESPGVVTRSIQTVLPGFKAKEKESVDGERLYRLCSTVLDSVAW